MGNSYRPSDLNHNAVGSALLKNPPVVKIPTPYQLL